MPLSPLFFLWLLNVFFCSPVTGGSSFWYSVVYVLQPFSYLQNFLYVSMNLFYTVQNVCWSYNYIQKNVVNTQLKERRHSEIIRIFCLSMYLFHTVQNVYSSYNDIQNKVVSKHSCKHKTLTLLLFQTGCTYYKWNKILPLFQTGCRYTNETWHYSSFRLDVNIKMKHGTTLVSDWI